MENVKSKLCRYDLVSYVIIQIHMIIISVNVSIETFGNTFEGLESDLIFESLANFDYLLPPPGVQEGGNTNNNGNGGVDIFDTPMQALHNSQYNSHQNRSNIESSQHGSAIMHMQNQHDRFVGHQSQQGNYNMGLMNHDSLARMGNANSYMVMPPNMQGHLQSSSMVQSTQDQYQPNIRGGSARSLEVSEGGEDKTSKVSKQQAVLAKEKRRERNKVLARKTRVKKKFELESLRDQAAKLHKENESLKVLVQTKLPPPVSASVLMQCDIQLPENVLALVNNMIARLECNQELFMDKMKTLQRAFCISNACAPDYPIVYASPGFVELTGYPLVEIIGRNCRFLQGPDTDKREAQRLGMMLRDGKETNATLKNYRRDCTSFWNFIQLAPMRDTEGRITLIVGVQCDVTSPVVLTESSGTDTFTSLTESTSLHTATQHQKQVNAFSSASSSTGSAGHTSNDDRESREGSSSSGERVRHGRGSPHSSERDSHSSGSRGESRTGSANGDSGEDYTE